MFADPAAAFRRGGAIHKRFDAYRARGGKLHTNCFSPRPVPPGAISHEGYASRVSVAIVFMAVDSINTLLCLSLLFVVSTVVTGIVTKGQYQSSLADVDWLHGGAEALLTTSNLKQCNKDNLVDLFLLQFALFQNSA